jgi:uncharacterized protein YebE (UPF0316 family)
MIEFISENSIWLIPVLIFFARVIDVTIGTIRIIFVSRGMKYLAPLFGFFEVLIWLIAIGQIMQNLTNWVNYLSYSAGFATGNFVGIYLENKLAMGMLSLRVITTEDASNLIRDLQEKNYGITSVAARGVMGNVRILITIIKRKRLEEIIQMIRTHNPLAFISIEDVRSVSGGVFPVEENRFETQLKLFKPFRKGK